MSLAETEPEFVWNILNTSQDAEAETLLIDAGMSMDELEEARAVFIEAINHLYMGQAANPECRNHPLFVFGVNNEIAKDRRQSKIMFAIIGALVVSGITIYHVFFR